MTTPNPADARRMVDEIRRALSEQKERVEEWNRQMLAAVDVIRAAAKREHGVIISVSATANTIEAVEHESVPVGIAYVFDRDLHRTKPARVHLAEWISTDEPLGTVASGYDPMRAYYLRTMPPPVTPPGDGIIVTTTEGA